MGSKKAVTDIILAIGVLVAILLVFVIGMRVFSVVVKETPQFLAKEMSTTANAALAAPEDVEITNTLPQARTEGFLKTTSKLWAGTIDPRESKTCATRLEVDNLKNFVAALGGTVGILPTITYSDGKITVAGNTFDATCKSFTEDSYAKKGDSAGFTSNAITTKYYDETTNTTTIGVKA